MKTKESRRAPRKKHDSVLEIYDIEGNFIRGVGRLVDFSTVGAAFSSTTVLEKDQPLQVRLRLLKEGAMDISAHVVWTKKKTNNYIYGIAFDDIEKIKK